MSTLKLARPRFFNIFTEEAASMVATPLIAMVTLLYSELHAALKCYGNN